MVFSSNVFLFLFLPLFLAIYYLTPNRGRLRNYVVLIGSYAFYAWWRVDFLVLFAGVTVWNYFVGMGIARAKRSEEHTSELQSLMRISYAVFCLKKKIKTNKP